MSQATQLVHWPGKDTAACDEHAIKLQRLGSFMGFPVSSTPLTEDRECDNCRNEQVKELQRLTGENK